MMDLAIAVVAGAIGGGVVSAMASKAHHRRHHIIRIRLNKPDPDAMKELMKRIIKGPTQ